MGANKQLAQAVHLCEPQQQQSNISIGKGGRGIWQRCYWEHQIRDETDYVRHGGVNCWGSQAHPSLHALAGLGGAADKRYSLLCQS